VSLQSGNRDSIKRYLLGDLSEQEREQVEQRLMSDDDLYEQLLVAEDELIDEYVSGELPEQERAKFSRHFLSVPELRQDVKFAAVLRKHALETAQETAQQEVVAPKPAAPARVSPFGWFGTLFMRPAFGASLAALLLAAVVLAAWLAAQNSQLKRQLGQLQARQSPTPEPAPDLQEQLASERLRNEQLSAELRRQQELLADESRKLQEVREAQGQQQAAGARTQTPRQGVAAFVALALTPGVVRDSGELKKVSLSPDTREVRVRLDLAAGGYSGYRAALRTADGREVWTARGLRAAGAKYVQVNIPARLLKPDDYQILLSGVTSTGEVEELNSYYFRVSK
jgi:hypothetical protein